MPYGQSPRGMETVTVKKDELLETLRKNRKEHRETFLEALDGYHKAALKALADRIEEAKNNKRVHLSFRLEQPKDQTKEYDRIIRMLEMSVASEVELTQQEFANYVMDDWSWMEQWLASNAGYSESASTKLAQQYRS
jgi:hypothetical protein